MFGYDPDDDPHRYNPDVHYRLFLSARDNKPCVEEFQNFDYMNCDLDRIIGPWAFQDKKTAREALQMLLIDAAKLLGVMPDFLTIQE